jgi:hypothetical protein
MKKDSGSSADWDNLGWIVPVVNSTTAIRVNVRSHRRLIGHVELSAQDLISIRKDHLELTEFSRSISVGGASTGTVTIIMKLNDSKSSYYKQQQNSDSLLSGVGVSSTLSATISRGMKGSPAAILKNLPPVSAKDAVIRVDGHHCTIGDYSLEVTAESNIDGTGTKRTQQTKTSNSASFIGRIAGTSLKK